MQNFGEDPFYDTGYGLYHVNGIDPITYDNNVNLNNLNYFLRKNTKVVVGISNPTQTKHDYEIVLEPYYGGEELDAYIIGDVPPDYDAISNVFTINYNVSTVLLRIYEITYKPTGKESQRVFEAVIHVQGYTEPQPTKPKKGPIPRVYQPYMLK